MNKATEFKSGNFSFLSEHDSLFVELAESAERAFASDPNTTLIKLRQLGEALAQHLAALSGIEFDEQTSQADVVLSQKLMRVLRKADNKAESRPELKQKLDELHHSWGVEPKSLHTHLHQLGPRQASEFIKQHSGLLNQLAEVKSFVGSEYMPLISDHEDEIRERIQSYGVHDKPEDYLDSFNEFIKQQLNQSAGPPWAKH